MPPRDDRTMDLLSWQMPDIAAAAPEDDVRASTLRGRMSRAVALVLRESPIPREEIAERMGDFLGETVTLPVLNAYASQAREEHTISAIRLIALCHATRDNRALQAILEPMGLSAVAVRYLPAIEEAMLSEKIEELQARKDQKRQQWRRGK